MRISEADLRTLVRETWAPALGIVVDTDGPPQQAEDRDMASQVSLRGAWAGTVTVSASRAAVATVAARMFGLPGDELADDDVDDAAREIANVLGGNVKPFAGGECDMSLPCDGAAVQVGGRQIAAIDFRIEGHPAMVAVHTV